MKVKITIDLHKQLLPFQYNHYIQGMIYSCLDEETASVLHSIGLEAGNKNYKMFTFSNLLGAYTVVNNQLKFNHYAYFFVSSLDETIITELYHALINRKTIRLGYLDAEIKKVEYIEDEEYQKEGIYILKTLSPVICSTTDNNHFTTYHDPRSEVFNQMIEQNLSNKYIALFQSFNEENYFHILSIIKSKSLMYKYKNTTYRCYAITFKVACTQDYLLLALNTGIGAKNAAGFGMVELK